MPAKKHEKKHEKTPEKHQNQQETAVKQEIKDQQSTIETVQEDLPRSQPGEGAAMKAQNPKKRSNTVLFVKNIPLTATSKDLEEFFGEIGPVRSCFVVQDKSEEKRDATTNQDEDDHELIQDINSGKTTTSLANTRFSKNKGFGFVTFAMPEDAQTAIEKLSITKFKCTGDQEGKILKLEFALAKKTAPSQLNKLPKEFPSVAAVAEQAQDTSALTRPQKKAVVKRPKLIIRNLAFGVREKDIRKAVAAFGNPKHIDVPLKPGSNEWNRGFAFVEFANMTQAKKCLESLNGTKLKGRVVAVDWTLPKDMFEKIAHEPVEADVDGEVDGDVKVKDEKVEENDDVDMEQDQAEEHPVDKEQEAEVSEDDQDDGVEIIMDTTEDEPSKHTQSSKRLPTADDGVTIFIRNLPLDSTKDEIHSIFSNFGDILYTVLTTDKATGKPRGTAFVCYKSNESAQKCLEAFEDALSTLPTVSSVLGLDESKDGSAQSNPLVFSNSKKDSKIRESILQPEVPLNSKAHLFHIRGHFLRCSLAVSKTKLGELTKERQDRRSRDKRCIYLLREGVIFPDSEAAKSLSQTELQRRLSSYTQRKALMERNPNLFVSKTRLSVRNLPKWCTEKELKIIARECVKQYHDEIRDGQRKPLDSDVVEQDEEAVKAFKNKKNIPMLKQVKLLREKDRIDPATKKPQSKGIAFLEFVKHGDALCCLRILNNNPSIILSATQKTKGEKVRNPVVEFAVENNLILKRREDKIKKIQEKQGGTGDKNGVVGDVKEDKKKRKRAAKEDGGEQEKKKQKMDIKEEKHEKQPKTKNNKKKRNDKVVKKDNAKGEEQPKSQTDKTQRTQAALPQPKSNKRKSSESNDKKQKSEPKQKKSKKNEKMDDFDASVEKYKKQMFSLDASRVMSEAKKKWFE